MLTLEAASSTVSRQGVRAAVGQGEQADFCAKRESRDPERCWPEKGLLQAGLPAPSPKY